MREGLHRLSQFFKILGNGVRLQILERLIEEPRTVVSLSEELDRPHSTISRHLGRLRDHDLVFAETDGAYRFYGVKRPELVRRSLGMEDDLKRDE